MDDIVTVLSLDRTDKVARFHNLPEEIMKYYALLDLLSPETAQRVARTNFLQVLPQRVRTRLSDVSK